MVLIVVLKEVTSVLLVLVKASDVETIDGWIIALKSCLSSQISVFCTVLIISKHFCLYMLRLVDDW